MVEEIGDKPRQLKYLDTDSFVPTDGWDKDRFVEMYECAICSGVVVKPLECSTSTCAMLYCEKCINALKVKECPRRCGSQTFHLPNKHIIKQLNELKFKCQHHPWCPEIIPYQMYEKHFSECKADQKPCDKPSCASLKK